MTELHPVVTSSADAAPLPFLATEHRVLVPASRTGGTLSMLDAGLVPAGFSPPMHFHRREHELFIVAGGEVRFATGTTSTVVEGEGAAWLPAGIPHSFEVIADARMYVITIPCDAGSVGGDYERFIRAVSAASSGTQVAAEELPELVARVGAAHDIPIVGPPLRPSRSG